MGVDHHSTIGRLLLAVVSLGILAVSSGAQSPGTQSVGTQSSGTQSPRTPRAVVHMPSPSAITFASIAGAQANLPVDVQQVRYVQDASTPGDYSLLTGIEERLRARPTADSEDQQFRIDFNGLAGQSLTSAEHNERELIYWPHSGFLHQHGGFRVHDPLEAARNYLLLYVDSRTRLDRPTHRFVVFPRFFARNVWLIEVDADTSYPLYSAEYTSFGMQINSLEVTSFNLLGSRDQVEPRWWEPTNLVNTFDTLDSARAAVPMLVKAPELPSTSLPFGYGFREGRLVVSDISPKVSLVLIYSDGIDEFFVIHSIDATPMQTPAVPTDGQHPYAVAFYQDMSIAQFMFQVDSIETMVIGRGGQFYLASVTRELLVRAVQGL